MTFTPPGVDGSSVDGTEPASRGSADLRTTVETVAAAGISAILTMIYIVYVGRVLGPADYADFAAALSVIYVGAAILTPITPAIARIAASLSARDDHGGIAGLRHDVMARAIVWAAGIAVVAGAGMPLIARGLKFRSPAALLLAAAVALSFAIVSIDRGVLQGLLRFGEYNLNVIAEAVIRCFGAVIVLQWWTASASHALASYLGAMIAAELLIAARFRGEWTGLTRRPADWRRLFGLAGPMLGLMMALAIFQNADMLAVKRWFAASDAGLYGAATALARSFGVLFVPLWVLAGPLLTRRYEAGQPILGAGARLCAWFIALSVAPLAIFVLWPEPIVRLLYGAAFAQGAWLIAPLGGVAIITYAGVMLTQVLITLDDFSFLTAYAAGALLLIAGLWMWHGSFVEVIAVLYVTQLAVLVVVVWLTVRHQPHDGSEVRE